MAKQPISPLTNIPLQQLMDALLDAETPLSPRFLHRMSDLEGTELEQIRGIWPRIPLWRRQAMMEDIEELSEAENLLSYESLGLLASSDEDPKVRLLALRTLEDYENKSLIPVLLRIMKNDPAAEVRAVAASGLGSYVYMGELDEIPRRMLIEIEDALLAVYAGSDAPEVRRAALEAISFSSRDEIPALIEEAFASPDRHWKASALFAMGRSASEQWAPQVLSMLESNLPVLRMEAARAAGELELKKATPILLELLDDPDEGTRNAAIWSLSQVGGEGIRDTLQRLYDDTDDEAEMDFIDSALDNLTFTEDAQLMPVIGIPEGDEDAADDDDDWYDEVDLEDIDGYEDDSDEDEMDDDFDDRDQD